MEIKQVYYIEDVMWETSQDIEVYKTLHKSDWSLPYGARITDSKNEIYDYEKVIDHYEEVRKSRQEKILDHYKTKYKHRNNGDGTFTKKSYKEPVYRYETVYYTEQEPVYRQEPIYKAKYYFDIDEWVIDDVIVLHGSKGIDDIKYWDVYETDKQQAGSRSISYYCIGSIKDDRRRYEVSKDIYDKVEKGRQYKCKYNGIIIEEIID